jgi:hypothetical protein
MPNNNPNSEDQQPIQPAKPIPQLSGKGLFLRRLLRADSKQWHKALGIPVAENTEQPAESATAARAEQSAGAATTPAPLTPQEIEKRSARHDKSFNQNPAI